MNSMKSLFVLLAGTACIFSYASRASADVVVDAFMTDQSFYSSNLPGFTVVQGDMLFGQRSSSSSMTGKFYGSSAIVSEGMLSYSAGGIDAIPTLHIAYSPDLFYSSTGAGPIDLTENGKNDRLLIRVKPDSNTLLTLSVSNADGTLSASKAFYLSPADSFQDYYIPFSALGPPSHWQSVFYLGFAFVDPSPETKNGFTVSRANGKIILIKATKPLPTCSITMSKASYGVGEIARATDLKIINPGPDLRPIELKVWLGTPESNMSAHNAGADGTVGIFGNFIKNFGPVDVLNITEATTAGTYEFSCRVSDPVTGEIQGQDRQFFQVVK